MPSQFFFLLCLSTSLSRILYPNQTPWHLDDTRFYSPLRDKYKRGNEAATIY